MFEVTDEQAEAILKGPDPLANDGVVRLRGLPFNSTEKDIIQFFTGPLHYMIYILKATTFIQENVYQSNVIHVICMNVCSCNIKPMTWLSGGVSILLHQLRCRHIYSDSSCTLLFSNVIVDYVPS